FSADGYAYQARLLLRDYEGDSEEVVLTESPANIVWGRKGADLYTPILASHAEVRNWRLGEALGAGYGTGQLAALIGAETGDWRLEILRAADHATIEAGNGALYWRGQVIADAYEDSTLTEPHEVTVQAVDGLGSLKEQPYYDTTTEPGERLPYEGRASLLT